MQKKYDLVIFDMDGTILDTLEDLKNSLNYALKINNFPEHSLASVRNFVGNGVHKLIERGVPQTASQEQIDQVFKIFCEYYPQHCSDYTKAYDGIIFLIQKLKSKNIKTAVVSNKADFAVQILCKQYFNGLFDYVLGAKENLPVKPAPDLVNIVLHEMKIEANKAVYVGDSEVDIATAKNAKIDGIIVDWGFRKREFLISQGAKIIVSTMDNLLKEVQ